MENYSFLIPVGLFVFYTVFSFPQRNQQFVIATDACNSGVEVVLYCDIENATTSKLRS